MNNWISVEERLPELKEELWGRSELTIVASGAGVDVARLEGAIGPIPAMWRSVSNSGQYGVIEAVRFWQPLPEPPEGV